MHLCMRIAGGVARLSSCTFAQDNVPLGPLSRSYCIDELRIKPPAVFPFRLSDMMVGILPEVIQKDHVQCMKAKMLTKMLRNINNVCKGAPPAWDLHSISILFLCGRHRR
jgi:hypothetical protein